ncbi:MAG: NUDIX hydrolase [Defluviitaleaceae bacterium]|nr:NUDIX hydrolase [Defluviitaleaceae bacterium]
MKNFETTKKTPVFNGRIFILEQREIKMPDGGFAVRDTIVHKGAAAVLPVTDDGRLVFVRQHRAAAEKIILEIPAGKRDSDDEDPAACAMRELEEETGFCAGRLTFMCKFFIAVGYSTEVLHLYLAENLTAGVQCLDLHEYVSVECYTLSEALAMISDGRIEDSKTIVAVQWYKINRA